MLALRGARLFDGVRRLPVRDPVVVMADGLIAGVGSAADVPLGVGIVDLGDVTLLPGLVDAHVHLAFDASSDPVKALDGTDDEVLAAMRVAASTNLAAGVTTVRDLGDRGYLALRLRDELARDPAAGPRILAAGPPITTARGHCWYLGGEADGAARIRDAVRERAERGADVIKVMASGGELTPGTFSYRPQYGVEELRAAVDEAHRCGLPITAHAHAGDAIANALAAGFDSIEHCSFLAETGIDERPDVIEALGRARMVVSATIAARPDVRLPPRMAAAISDLVKNLDRLVQAGVTLVASSDAGIGPPKPHGVLPYAPGRLVDMIGWSTVDALRAVTSVPAKVCGVDDRVGRLSPGLDADVIAVAGDPLADPNALADVRFVFRQGRRAG